MRIMFPHKQENWPERAISLKSLNADECTLVLRATWSYEIQLVTDLRVWHHYQLNRLPSTDWAFDGIRRIDAAMRRQYHQLNGLIMHNVFKPDGPMSTPRRSWPRSRGTLIILILRLMG
jgi:hypothetical protein